MERDAEAPSSAALLAASSASPFVAAVFGVFVAGPVVAVSSPVRLPGLALEYSIGEYSRYMRI